MLLVRFFSNGNMYATIMEFIMHGLETTNIYVAKASMDDVYLLYINYSPLPDSNQNLIYLMLPDLILEIVSV